jgi:hypothetical protein
LRRRLLTNTAGGTIVEKEKEEAGVCGEGLKPGEPGGEWFGGLKGLDCGKLFALIAPSGFNVCNAPMAQPLVNTKAEFRYVVEVELGLVLDDGFSYVAENSPLHPGALVDQPGDTAFLKYNKYKKTTTKCTGKSPDLLVSAVAGQLRVWCAQSSLPKNQEPRDIVLSSNNNNKTLGLHREEAH